MTDDSRSSKRDGSTEEGEEVTNDSNAGKVKIAFQGLGQKLYFSFGTKAKLGKVMKVFSESVNIPVDELQFSFEGSNIRASNTAGELGLETSDQIDVFRRTDGGYLYQLL